MTRTATTASPSSIRYATDLIERAAKLGQSVEADFDTMTQREVSNLITNLKMTIRSLEQEAAPKFHDGAVYVHEGTYVQVRKSKTSGRFYAKSWNGRSFEYAAGLVFKLTSAMLATEAELELFGHTYTVCAVCGRTLTNPESITRGIGPICWGRQAGFLGL